MQSFSVSLRRWWTWSLWFQAAMPEARTEDKTEEALLAAILAEPPGSERREAIRHLSGRLTRVRFISLFQCPPWPAIIRDVSLTGVGLLMDEPPAPGTFLTVELNDRRRVGAQVVALRVQPTGDWLVGCVLLRPLTGDELEDLI